MPILQLIGWGMVSVAAVLISFMVLLALLVRFWEGDKLTRITIGVILGFFIGTLLIIFG